VTRVETVAEILRGFRFNYASEDALQEGIHACLADHGMTAIREHRLDARSRIDVWVPFPDGGVAVEAKVEGDPDSVARQVARYLSYRDVLGVVLVTPKVRHVALERLDRVEVVSLATLL
jgi:hypothetical protein